MKRVLRSGMCIVAVTACSAFVGGCSGVTTHVGDVYGYCGKRGCGTVVGQVKRCGGPPGSLCAAVGFISVALRDLRGRLVIAEHAGAGQKLNRFSLAVPGSGPYALDARVDGFRVRRVVDLRARHVLHADLTLSVR